jgi:hypothetical protein
MEAIANKYGAKIIASSASLEEVKDLYHIREIDRVCRKNESEPISFYEIMASSGESHNHDMMSVVSKLTLDYYKL